MYSFGLTTWPDEPTWYSWGSQPASTTGRLAPIAPPSAVASGWITSGNFAGSPTPRPPDTMMSAFERSTPFDSDFLISTNLILSAPASSVTASGSTEPAVEPENGAVAPGCTVATTLSAEVEITASSLPLNTRRLKVRWPSAKSIAKQSETKPASSAAAIRGATSQPLGVLEISTTSPLAAAIAARIAAAAVSAL